MNNRWCLVTGGLFLGATVACGSGGNKPAATPLIVGDPCESIAPAMEHATWELTTTWEAASPMCAAAAEIPWDAPMVLHVVPSGEYGNFSQTEKTAWAASELVSMGTLGKSDNEDGRHCLYTIGVNNIGHVTAETPEANAIFQVYLEPGKTGGAGTAKLERADPATFESSYTQGPGSCTRSGTVAFTITPI